MRWGSVSALPSEIWRKMEEIRDYVPGPSCNVLARVVAQAPSTISSADIRRDLHWLPVNHRISYKLSLFTWKALYTAEPSYLSELISPNVPTRTLHSTNTYLLAIPTGRVLQVTSPHALFLFLHRQPGTLYLNIFAV